MRRNFLLRGLNKLSAPLHKTDNLSISDDYRFVWFRVAKAGTRSLMSLVSQHTDAYNGFFCTERQYRDYFKFAFVRNPWDRLVSCYEQKIVGERIFPECWGQDFRYFVDFVRSQDLSRIDRHIRRQSALFPVRDMDFIGRFENLEQDFGQIAERIGLGGLSLPHRNKTSHRHYSAYYDDRTRELVGEAYAEDIRLFGYEF